MTTVTRTKQADGELLQVDPETGRTHPQGRTKIVEKIYAAPKPPIGVHESVVTNTMLRDKTGKFVADAPFDRASHEMRAASALLEQAKAAFDDIANDPELSKASALARASTAVEKLVERAHKNADTALAAIGDALHASQSNHRVPVANANSSDAAEIRAVLRGMSEAERNEVIAVAMRDNDATTLGAYFAGRHFLSGETAESHKSRISEYRKKYYPAEFEREARLTLAHQAIERGKNAAAGWRASVLNDSAIAQAVRDAKKAREAALRVDEKSES